MRSITITESQPTVLDLNNQEAEALAELGERLASNRQWWGAARTDDEDAPAASVISVAPTTGTGWIVRVSDAVGLVVISGLQIVVQPKIPANHLLYLFSRTQAWPRLEEQIGHIATEASLFEVVVHWFLNALESLMRSDLLRDYRAQVDEVTAVRGQLEAVPTASRYYTGSLLLTCNYEEFDIDIPINRVLKGTARSILQNANLRDGLRRRAQRAVVRMDDVGDIRGGDLATGLDSRTKSYGDALLLARHVLRAEGRAVSEGGSVARCFLIRTPEMVEEGIRTSLKEGLADLCTVVKSARQLVGSRHTINPDLLFQPYPAIGDVKYKAIREEWSRPDLYQSVAFAVGFHARSAAIVTFAEDAHFKIAPVHIGDVTASSLKWIFDPAWLPLDAERELVRQTRSWLSSVPGPQ